MLHAKQDGLQYSAYILLAMKFGVQLLKVLEQAKKFM
jgi:hypothetical protein